MNSTETVDTVNVDEILAIIKSNPPYGKELIQDKRRGELFRKRLETVQGAAENIRDIFPASKDGALKVGDQIYLNRALALVVTTISKARGQKEEQVRREIEAIMSQ